jgi:hypothetical protein
MKLLNKWSLVLFFCINLLLGFSIPGQTTRPPATPTPTATPQTPDFPPVVPNSLLEIQGPSEALSASGIGYEPPLKAVLLVGPIDGDYGSWTQSEKKNMNLAATELQANGVTVYKFYAPNNDWDQIKAAADGAHFLFYRGHGVYWGSMPSPQVGGFALKDKFVSPDDIRNELNLAPNAIIMLYGCFTAGSAGNDTTSISSTEAKRRVAMYSDPFFDIGAGGYYANWFGDAFQMYVRYLFRGKTLGKAYESYFDFNSATVKRYTHPNHPAMALWLDKDYWYHPKPQYNNAFAGQPSHKLTDLWPVMEVSPLNLIYLTEPSFPNRHFAIQVDYSTSGSIAWTAEITPSVPWLHAQPLSGNSGEQITIVITPTTTLGTYQTNLRIETNTPQVFNAEQTIPVTLRVVDHVYFYYLPLILK